MANFVKRQIARESVEGTGTVVPDGLELPHESVEGILADLKEKENETDRDLNEASVLEEDTQETEGQLDVLNEAEAAANGEGDPDDSMEAGEDMTDEEVEAVDVAQESIRQRWGLDRQSIARESYGSRKKRQVARESMWQDFKGLLKRFWEWLKEQGRKIKDRWIGFTNAGKSLQKRAKKYTEQIKKLGKLKDGKDTVSGSFIDKLSAGGKFHGNDLSFLKEFSKDDMAEAYSHLTEMATKSAEGMSEAIGKFSEGNVEFGVNFMGEEYVEKLVKEAFQRAEKFVAKSDIPGNLVFECKVNEDGGLETTVTDYDGTSDSDVKTPTVSQLSAAAKFLEDLGKTIEKIAKAYHASAQRREKLERAVEKAINNMDKLNVDKVPRPLSERMTKARRAVSGIVKLGSEIERLNGRIQRNIADGMSGYIAASIACYEVRKN